MAYSLNTAAQAGCPDYGAQIGQRLLQTIVNNNIVEFADMTHLGLCCGKSTADHFVAVGAAVS